MNRVLKIVILIGFLISFIFVGLTWTKPLSGQQLKSMTEDINSAVKLDSNGAILLNKSLSGNFPVYNFAKSEPAILFFFGTALIGFAGLIRRNNRSN